jgi:hypothetical protein
LWNIIALFLGLLFVQSCAPAGRAVNSTSATFGLGAAAISNAPATLPRLRETFAFGLADKLVREFAEAMFSSILAVAI